MVVSNNPLSSLFKCDKSKASIKRLERSSLALEHFKFNFSLTDSDVEFNISNFSKVKGGELSRVSLVVVLIQNKVIFFLLP